VGKLPPALPALQAELGLTLVQSGFLLSMVQLAGLTLAVFMGMLADGMGLKRSMVRGLLLLALASGAGGLSASVPVLLLCRALEGLGLLLVALPRAPRWRCWRAPCSFRPGAGVPGGGCLRWSRWPWPAGSGMPFRPIRTSRHRPLRAGWSVCGARWAHAAPGWWR
jgi:MFS family permease